MALEDELAAAAAGKPAPVAFNPAAHTHSYQAGARAFLAGAKCEPPMSANAGDGESWKAGWLYEFNAANGIKSAPAPLFAPKSAAEPQPVPVAPSAAAPVPPAEVARTYHPTQPNPKFDRGYEDARHGRRVDFQGLEYENGWKQYFADNPPAAAQALKRPAVEARPATVTMPNARHTFRVSDLAPEERRTEMQLTIGQRWEFRKGETPLKVATTGEIIGVRVAMADGSGIDFSFDNSDFDTPIELVRQNVESSMIAFRAKRAAELTAPAPKSAWARGHDAARAGLDIDHEESAEFRDGFTSWHRSNERAGEVPEDMPTFAEQQANARRAGKVPQNEDAAPPARDRLIQDTEEFQAGLKEETIILFKEGFKVAREGYKINDSMPWASRQGYKHYLEFRDEIKRITAKTRGEFEAHAVADFVAGMTAAGAGCDQPTESENRAFREGYAYKQHTAPGNGKAKSTTMTREDVQNVIDQFKEITGTKSVYLQLGAEVPLDIIPPGVPFVVNTDLPGPCLQASAGDSEPKAAAKSHIEGMIDPGHRAALWAGFVTTAMEFLPDVETGIKAGDVANELYRKMLRCIG